ncbi:MAG TPA: Hsp20/alpha crystallin family protein [Solirubrobacteraceae bacterium]|jgi:HSP20 family protein|nr:Hsp20/alpha crystallin family protein [Solirubrobacteraceae bacterium]
MATMLVEPFAPWLRDLSQVLQGQGTTAPFVPPADVMVDDDGVTVFMDVPGLRSEDLEIELENDLLTVRGERPYPYKQDGEGSPVQRIERRFGRFERTLRVPAGLDPDAVEAALTDGVLRIRIPLPETKRARRIEIKAGENGGSREGSGPGDRGEEAGQPRGSRQQSGVGS